MMKALNNPWDGLTAFKQQGNNLAVFLKNKGTYFSSVVDTTG